MQYRLERHIIVLTFLKSHLDYYIFQLHQKPTFLENEIFLKDVRLHIVIQSQ